MKAAVVTSFAAPPRCADHPEPVATGEHDMVVEVIAAPESGSLATRCSVQLLSSIDVEPGGS